MTWTKSQVMQNAANLEANFQQALGSTQKVVQVNQYTKGSPTCPSNIDSPPRGCSAAPRIHTELETGPIQSEKSCQERNAFGRIEFLCQSSLQPESSNPSTFSSATFSPVLVQGLHAPRPQGSVCTAWPASLRQSFFAVDSWHCMSSFLNCAAS